MKTLQLRISEAAVADILEQADWYRTRGNSALGNRWEEAVTSALLRVTRNPKSGASCRFSAKELAEVRRMIVPKFPKHLVFFQSLRDEVVILRVLHGARDLESLFERSSTNDE